MSRDNFFLMTPLLFEVCSGGTRRPPFYGTGVLRAGRGADIPDRCESAGH